MILIVDFALKLRKYTLLKCFMCLQLTLKNFSTTLHSWFNYHTLPVTPFKKFGFFGTRFFQVSFQNFKESLSSDSLPIFVLFYSLRQFNWVQQVIIQQVIIQQVMKSHKFNPVLQRMMINIIIIIVLKRVFVENKRGYRLTAKNKRF